MTDSQFYSDEMLAKLDKAVEGLLPSFGIVSDYLLHKFQADGVAREYIEHGFLRRLNIMRQCIERIDDICPPNTCKLSGAEVAVDIAIFLQAFYIHLYGAFENLARVSVEIGDTNLSENEKRQSSFLKKKPGKNVKKALPGTLRAYLATGKTAAWRDHLNSFRHSLAHRIPLYIPPSSIRPEDLKRYNELEDKRGERIREVMKLAGFLQNSHENASYKLKMAKMYRKGADYIKSMQSDLEFFYPVATHSFAEESGFVGFHAQVISNWNTILDFLCKFLDEMQPPLGQQLQADLENAAVRWSSI